MLAAEEEEETMLKLRDQIQVALTAEEEGGSGGCAARAEAYRYVLRLLDDQQQDSVKTLFYLLLRDHLPAGTVEGLVADVEAQRGRRPVYSNEFLASYAAELSARVGVP